MKSLGVKVFLVIALSLLVALMLSILPLPSWVVDLRPPWVALVIIYWVMALPHRMSVGWAWIAGLLLDVLQGTLLGEHALALAVIAYIVAKGHLRLRLYPHWQQTGFVLLFLALYQLLLLWPQALIRQLPHSWFYCLVPVVGMVLWPWVYHLLRATRKKFALD